MSSDITRRDFLATATTGIALAAMSESVRANEYLEDDKPATLTSAFAANYELKPLPFDPAKLNGLSEKLIKSHWENNYGGSVKALNTVKQRLQGYLEDANIPPFMYNDLKREHLLRTGSVILHDLYFGNLGGTDKADANVTKLLAEAFGSSEIWEKEFKRIGAGLGGGSGWVVLGYNIYSGLLENYWQWDHAHAPSATLPILVMDMYEHSYQMDFGAGAAAYIDAFMRNIHWQTVATRLEKAIKIRAVFTNGNIR